METNRCPSTFPAFQGPKTPVVRNSFEKSSWRGNRLICGIDEVGRGCLAGPVVTAAVILPANTDNQYLKDSKCMSERQRLIAHAWIVKNCWYGIGIVHNRLIDQHNIYQATQLAMKRALVQALAVCPQRPVAVLIDAVPLKIADTGNGDLPVFHFYKGESKSSSIAAASILAKVTRDTMMKRMAAVFPGYGLDAHKGYATKDHRDNLHTQTHSIIHRHSFLGSVLAKKKDEYGNQNSFC